MWHQLTGKMVGGYLFLSRTPWISLNFTACTMRIIGGKFKGRRFNPPADKWPTRPTTDFAKEGLFNILSNRIDFTQTKMLDLFGGTGSHSYEAISRGCLDVTYIDMHPPCAKFVSQIAKQLEIEECLTIKLVNVTQFLKRSEDSFDYIFAGPPYALTWLNQIPEMIFQARVLKPDGLLVLEHNPNHHFESQTHFQELRKYGGTHFSFFTANQAFDD